MRTKITALFTSVSACFSLVVNAQECNVLRVAGTSNWEPVAYINQETHKPTGIAYDFSKIVGEKLNIPVEVDADLPWKRVLRKLKFGEIDMTAGIYWTKERATLYQYTSPIFTNNVRVFVVKGKEFPFEKLEDLIGRVGGVPLGGSFGEEFDTFARKHKLKLESVERRKQLVTKTLLGRNDYFIQDYLDGMRYLNKAGLQGQIVALPYPLSITNVYFAISRKSPCLVIVPQINAIINKANQDGTLQTIINKYIE